LRALVASLGAQLVSLPILLASFHLLPWIGPAANLVAVPVAGLLLAAAWIALLADLALPGLGAPWFRACETLTAALRTVAGTAAHAPGAARSVPDDPALVTIAAAGAALLVWAASRRVPPAAERAPRPRSFAAVTGAALCLAAIVLAATAPELRPPHGRAWLVALDVGQGDALAIGFEDGWWLVDAGPRTPRSDAGASVVLPFLRWAGVRRIEALAVTHDDSDHWGGVASLRDGIAVRRVLAPVPKPGVPGPARRMNATPVAAGDVLHVSPRLVALWPERGPTRPELPRGVTADNACGLVLELGAGQGRALLLADVDSTVEARLPVAPGVAVLKVAHHGAATSSGAALLERALPRLAIVSCGRGNRFGHPDPGAIERLERTCAAIARTDESGAVWCELDEGGMTRLDWRGGEVALAARALRSGRHARPRAPRLEP
jgi:competence protein ComEC